jgi:hypothetical protein
VDAVGGAQVQSVLVGWMLSLAHHLIHARRMVLDTRLLRDVNLVDTQDVLAFVSTPTARTAMASGRGCRLLFWPLVTIAAVSVAIPACAPGLEIGHFTVLSTRVYESGHTYTLLGRFEGSSRPLLGEGNVEEAVEDALRKAPGGVYMTNVLVKHGGFPTGYDVEGDVYGIAAGPAGVTRFETN